MGEEVATTLSFKTADELTTFLMDLQGQMATMQETIDKLAPVEDAPAEETPAEEVPSEEVPTDDEVSEIDKLLQES